MLLIASALGSGPLDAPHQPQARLSETVVISPTVQSWTRLEAGSPLVYSGSGKIGFGVSAYGSLLYQAVPSEKRDFAMWRSTGGGPWLLMHPGKHGRHALGLILRGTHRGGGPYALMAQEASTGVSVSYRGWHRSRWIDVAGAVELGLDGERLLHGTLAPKAEFHAVQDLLHFGLNGLVGLQRVWVAGVHSRLQLGSRLELELTMNLAGTYDAGAFLHPVPALSVRYRHPWKKQVQPGWELPPTG